MRGPCTSSVGRLLFPQSEKSWAYCTPNIVQTLLFCSRLLGLNRHWMMVCTSTIGKLLFPQSEKGWACCTRNVVQTLVFCSQPPGLNRYWIDLAHSLLENYFFHSQKKVGPIVLHTLCKRWYFAVHYHGRLKTG